MQGYVGTLPKKYDRKRIEEEVKAIWDKEDTYALVKKARSTGTRFYFLDGPPFPSSDTPHIGTCWNKILKDVVLRYRRAKGFNVRDQPGYDCHGLPIELAVEQKFNVKTKKEILDIGLERFVMECKRFAEANSNSMTRIFRDLGVWMDWVNPYMTHDDPYIESDWWSIKRAWSKGLFQHGQKVVHWCPRCETVLSDYEVVMEYKMLRDPSIYVKFPLEGKESEFILIWTTTPWTLPSNVAVMVNPDLQYVKVRSGNETYIMAESRVREVETEVGVNFEILQKMPGSKLEGLMYKSPMEKLVPAQSQLKGAHRIVLSNEYVTVDEGTGCVHCAPGHGEEDYEVGLKYGLPVLMLVDDQGKFAADAGKYSGRNVRESNDSIIEDLRRLGYILFSGEIEHRSPVCWRCKTPLIIRATDQWFIRVTQLKDQFIKDIDSTLWIPEWAGASQFKNWLINLRDWVVSRQRFWGTPIPVWICRSCNAREVVESKDELLEKAVAPPNIPNLHMPWVDEVKLRCRCGGEMQRIPDVLVGWFDSGAASYACLQHPRLPEMTKLWWPADFITEGRDQISGWFFALLRAGVVAMDRIPYKTVLMHGFMLDEKGREMHKSLGNYVTPQEVIEKFGRDTFRYYILNMTIWEDLKFSWEALNQLSRDLEIFWNTYVFTSTYMNLDKFNPAEWPLNKLSSNLNPEDKWLLSRVTRTIKEVTSAMDQYHIHEAVRKLKTFLIEDVSRTYIKFVRRRTWIEETDPSKLAAYATLYYCLKRALVMLAPITPFITEAIYRGAFRGAEPESPITVHLSDWPVPDEEWINDTIEAEMDWAKRLISAVALARMNGGIKHRQPVPEILVTTKSAIADSTLETFRSLLMEQTNTRRLTVNRGEDIIKLEKDGRLEGFTSTEFEEGKVYLDVRFSKDELAEGLARDIIRRLQQMRKEMDLAVDSYVDGFVIPPTEEAAERILLKKDWISSEVRIKELIVSHKPIEFDPNYYVKNWQVNGEEYKLALRSTATLEQQNP